MRVPGQFNVHCSIVARSSKLRAKNYDIVGFDKPEHIAGHFLDQIGMRFGGRQEGDVAFQLAANGLKAARFERQQT